MLTRPRFRYADPLGSLWYYHQRAEQLVIQIAQAKRWNQDTATLEAELAEIDAYFESLGSAQGS